MGEGLGRSKILLRKVPHIWAGETLREHRFVRKSGVEKNLEKLASISVADCEFIDQMMTKYSRYEHAQSSEAQVELPEPDELAADVNLLKN